MKRRQFLKAAAGSMGAAAVAMPAFLRHAFAADPIKIGVPTSLSGPLALLGEQTKRGGDFFVKEVNAKGGVIGRPIELIYEDTAANPAVAVRKAQQLVEKDGVKFLVGIAASSEALAVSPKCPEWNCLLIATIPGAGALTSTAFNRNFFRINMSSVMGSRVTSLYLKQSPTKKFYALGSDYAYGHDSVSAFSKLVKQIGRETIGTAFPPLGTKDFASYIAKIKESGAEACLVSLPGQDGVIFFKQAAQFGLNHQVRFLIESFETKFLDATGDAMEGSIGAARYVYTIDTPKNKKFVAGYHELYKLYPDYPDAMAYDALDWLTQLMTKVGSATDIDKVITAWEDAEFNGLVGPILMRKCDHQVEQPGFMAEAVKGPGAASVLIPKILTTYPREQIVPKCRSDEFAD
jgi:branched-chain amino acid transport system substrate-binding protein